MCVSLLLTQRTHSMAYAVKVNHGKRNNSSIIVLLSVGDTFLKHTHAHADGFLGFAGFPYIYILGERLAFRLARLLRHPSRKFTTIRPMYVHFIRIEVYYLYITYRLTARAVAGVCDNIGPKTTVFGAISMDLCMSTSKPSTRPKKH